MALADDGFNAGDEESWHFLIQFVDLFEFRKLMFSLYSPIVLFEMLLRRFMSRLRCLGDHEVGGRKV